MEYELNVLTPRNPDMTGVSSTHGSSVRERYFSQGTIETILDGPGGLIDPKTEYETVVLINPSKIGASSVSKRLGEYFLFPRQILGIAVDTKIPAYLNKDERAFVSNFYSGNFTK